MLRLKDTRYENTAAFLSSAIGVAEHYGFRRFDDADRKSNEELRNIRKRVSKNEREISFARREERSLMSAAKLGALCARNPSESLLLWRIVKDSKNGIPSAALELHVIGTNSAIAEAILIVTAHAILQEGGLAGHMVAINNIGSSESSSRFVRDVENFLKKHIESISPTLREKAAEDPLGTLVLLIERGHPAMPRAPQSMEYLTEEERRRFWDLLEYLEVFGLPYELSSHVLGSRDCWAHTLFQIAARSEEGGAEMIVAFGGRYDPLASRFAAAPAGAAMISINCEIRGRTNPPREARGVPSIYFAHLGGEARRRALGVLENLRVAGIPLHHGLYHERIGEQMASARQFASPCILIMGHKEAIEGTILVREVATNSQEAIPLPELPTYLKRKRLLQVA